MVKKIFISLLLIFTGINSDPVGPKLSNVTIGHIFNNRNPRPLISVKLPNFGFYKMAVLDQGRNATCGRSTLFNLFHGLNALQRENPYIIKTNLKPIFNAVNFAKFNVVICQMLGINNFYSEITYARHINHALDMAKNGRFSQNRILRTILPSNTAQIAQNITPAIWPKKSPAGSIAMQMINNGQFNTDHQIISILNGLADGKRFLINLRNLKATNKKVLGIPCALPMYNNITMLHYVSIICRKNYNTGNGFELYALDSCNANSSVTIVPILKFIKHLLNLPIGRLQKIITSRSLNNY